MSFSINPLKYGSVFVLPGEIADKYLRLCSGSQLRALLWLYRNAPAQAELTQLAAGTGLSADEAADALEFWQGEGFVLDGAKTEASAVQPETEDSKPRSEEETVSIPEKKAKIKPPLPSFKQIHDRLVESPEVQTLFVEAQEHLGRTIGTGDQAVLLQLLDFFGLPIDIILMLCGYAAQQGKRGNMRYIAAMGENWSEREIDTDEKAQAELKRLESIDKNWDNFRSITGIRSPVPTKLQQPYITKWYTEQSISTDMLEIAYAKMSEHTEGMSFSYMDKILQRWQKENIKTPADVEKSEAEFEKQMAEKAAKRAAPRTGGKKAEPEGGFNTAEASYDIEKANQQAFSTPVTHKKRRK